MKIQILSDLHIEGHRDRGYSIFNEVVPSELPDVLVLAGDITAEWGLWEALGGFCDTYPHVVFVTGNHEYYGSTREIITEILGEISAEFPNLHWLDNQMVEIDGVRFLGGTLWFEQREDDHLYRSRLNDFKLIHDLDSWVHESNRQCKGFLREHVRPGDVVVTHHMPHPDSSPRFRGSPLNRFFLSDCRGIIWDNKPSVWIHGHSHDCSDYTEDETRIVANPFGYLHEPKDNFQAQLVIEVP